MVGYTSMALNPSNGSNLGHLALKGLKFIRSNISTFMKWPVSCTLFSFNFSSVSVANIKKTKTKINLFTADPVKALHSAILV